MMRIWAGNECPRTKKKLTRSNNPAVLAGACGGVQHTNGCWKCPAMLLRGPATGEERIFGFKNIPFCKEG